MASRKSLGFKYPAELFTPDAFDFGQHDAALLHLVIEIGQGFLAPSW
jgi:hypothetical protein